MVDFHDDMEFRKICIWLNLCDGFEYGCVEINARASMVDFIEQLGLYTDKQVREVNFSPYCNSGTDRDLIRLRNHRSTVENFLARYGSNIVLIFTDLATGSDRSEQETADLMSEININREVYVQYPCIVLFVFPHWFMTALNRKGTDFRSCISYHADFSFLERNVMEGILLVDEYPYLNSGMKKSLYLGNEGQKSAPESPAGSCRRLYDVIPAVSSSES